jgi:glutamine amidotransferase
MMLDEGLERDAERAAQRAAARVIEASRQAGIEPSFKFTAAFSDGERLHSVRFATDADAPTLYMAETASGRCIVSEPFDREGGAWHAVPPSSFVTITRTSVAIRPFRPMPAKLAAA